MTAQNHMIKKQILDLTLDSDTGSFALQSRMSEIFKSEIVPLLDTYCTKIGGGPDTYRVNRLEIDLGTLDKKDPAAGFKEKINELFPEKLAEALGVRAGVYRFQEYTRERTPFSDEFRDRAGRQAGIHRLHEHRGEATLVSNDFYDRARAGGQPVISGKSKDFELLEFFIREGRLPWWVKGMHARGGNLPEITKLLAEAAAGEGAKMRKFLTGIADQPALVQRLFYNADKSTLQKLIALFHPRQAKEICNRLSHELILAFRNCPLFAAISPAKVRTEIWTAVLGESFASEGRDFNRDSIVENVVKHLAKAFGSDENAIYSYLAKKGKGGWKGGWYERTRKTGRHKATVQFDQRTSVYLQQLETIEKLVKELLQILPGKKKLLEASASALATEELIIVLRQLSTIVPGIKEVVLNLLKKTAKSNIFSVTAPEMDEEEKKTAEEFEKLSKRLYHALEAVLDKKPAETKDEVFAKADNIMVSIDKLRKTMQVAVARAESGAVDADVFTDAEEIYLRNAGLVLLWPYLPAFFAAAGLVARVRAKEKGCAPEFLNEEARERAVLLLHYLAFGAKEGWEYDMTLNKILCGLAPGQPVNPCLGDRITKKEIREAEGFLQAVVRNWPVMKKTSAPAFRSMFLRREGVLFTRDGCRVLRAAEEAHDVLLDRLPWGIGTVKLPWMKQLLLVEWRR